MLLILLVIQRGRPLIFVLPCATRKAYFVHLFSFIAAFHRREAWTVNEQIKFIQDFLNVSLEKAMFLKVWC